MKRNVARLMGLGRALPLLSLITFILVVLAALPVTALAESPHTTYAAPVPAPAPAPALAPAHTPAHTPAGRAVLYLFWGDGCPHCAEEKPFLERLKQQYPGLEVRDYEVWYDQGNKALFARMTAAYGFEPQAVPTTFLGDQHWVGYNDQVSQGIESAVKACLANGCKDAGAGIIAPAETSTEVAPTAVQTTTAPATTAPAAGLELPLIGSVNLEGQSLLVSTALIGFVDGFNPCSLWTLTMLLAITLHTGSRRKVLIIGLIFLTVTAGVYALFIAGLFTAFTFAGFTGWLQVVVALMALFFAAVNIKDYFWYKEGVSLTIADEKKPGLLRRMRGLVDASQSFWGLAGATVVLSAGVSLVEFTCTAGFPVYSTKRVQNAFAQGRGDVAWRGGQARGVHASYRYLGSRQDRAHRSAPAPQRHTPLSGNVRNVRNVRNGGTSAPPLSASLRREPVPHA